MSFLVPEIMAQAMIEQRKKIPVKAEPENNFICIRDLCIHRDRHILISYDSFNDFKTSVKIVKYKSPGRYELSFAYQDWFQLAAQFEFMEYFFTGTPKIELADVLLSTHIVKFRTDESLIKICELSKPAVCFAIDRDTWNYCRTAFQLANNMVQLYENFQPKLNQLFQDLSQAVRSHPQWPITHNLQDLVIDFSGYPELADPTFTGLLYELKYSCAKQLMAKAVLDDL